MKAVRISEAKTRFNALISDAERGETTLVTRKGKPVACVAPVATPKRRAFGFDDGLGFIAEDFNAPLPPQVLASFEG